MSNVKIKYYDHGKIEENHFDLPELTIGRGTTSHLKLIAPGISREHVKVEIKDNTIYLTDLGSSNGTKINGEKISPFKPHLVSDDDNVFLGTSKSYLQFSLGAHSPVKKQLSEDKTVITNHFTKERNTKEQEAILASKNLGIKRAEEEVKLVEVKGQYVNKITELAELEFKKNDIDAELKQDTFKLQEVSEEYEKLVNEKRKINEFLNVFRLEKEKYSIQLENQTKEIEEKNNELHILKNKLIEEEQNLQSVNKRKEAIVTENNLLKTDLEHLIDNKKDTLNKLIELKDDCLEETEKIKSRQEYLNNLKTELIDFNKKITPYREQLHLVKNQVKELERERSKLNEQVEFKKLKLKSFELSYDELSTKTDQAKILKLRLESDCLEKEHYLNNLKTDIIHQQNIVQEIKAERDQAKESLAFFKEKNIEIKGQNESIQETIQEFKIELEQWNHKKEIGRSDYHKFEAELNYFKKTLEELRMDFQQTSDKKAIAEAQYQNFLNLSESYKKDEQSWIEKIKEYKQVAKALEIKNNDIQAEISKIEMTEFSLRKRMTSIQEEKDRLTEQKLKDQLDVKNTEKNIITNAEFEARKIIEIAYKEAETIKIKSLKDSEKHINEVVSKYNENYEKAFKSLHSSLKVLDQTKQLKYFKIGLGVIMAFNVLLLTLLILKK